METEQYKYGDITQKIIGCAMKVHRYFGLGFPENILEKLGFKCQAEVKKDIY